MRILVIPFGSHGDVHPLAGLGEALRDRGHEVLMLVNPHFEPLVRKAGLGFIPVGTEEEFLRILEHPDLWHPRRAFGLVARGVAASLEPLFEAIQAHCIPGRTVVVAASLAFPARVARELDPALPLVTVHLQPSVLLSAEQPPKLPGAHIQAHWPRWLKRFLIQTIHRVVDRVYARPLNAFRAKLGLSSPVRGVMERYWHSPDLGIGLFPDWFAPPAADWPVPFQLVGFPLYDESHHQPLPPSAEAFLQSGEPPVVFTFGSAMARGERLFRTALDVCRGLGRRGLFLARFEDQIPRPLPPAIHYERYIPFSQVFPRACAVVHHGGIGTTAQALAAGIPQVVIALAHDQYDNGDRIERLGVGRMLPRNRLNARRLRQALESLIGSASASGQARAIAERFKGERPLESAADLIESLAARRGIPLQTGRPLAGGDTPR